MTTATLNAPESKEFIADKMFVTILPEEVDQILQKKDFNSIIVDVRETRDFIKGHVPGAINLPKGNWGKISGLQFEQTLIVYCYSNTCPLAAGAMLEFVRYGFPVMEMEGGFEAWKGNRLPVEI
jgi:rhodanese-related sulfurtransferase